MELVERYLPWLVLIGGIGLLQYHGVMFWSEYVGSSGIFWSVLLELLALWLWSLPRVSLQTIVVTAVLLSGPFYYITKPLIEGDELAAQEAESRPERIALLQKDIARLEASLQTYDGNSEKRGGWAEYIENTHKRLDDRNRRLDELLATPNNSATVLTWQRKAVIVMQAVALILFQFGVVRAIRTLSRRHYKSKTSSGQAETEAETVERAAPRQSVASMPMPMIPGISKAIPTVEVVETKETPPQEAASPAIEGDEGPIPTEVVEAIANQLVSHLASNGLSARQFADEHGFNQRDLSLIRNHRRNLEEQKRTATDSTIRRLGEVFGVFEPTEREGAAA